MNSRPVLAMSFYSLNQPSENDLSFISPYEQMKRQAETQKQQKIKRIEQKKKNAQKVIDNLNQKLNRFFPQEPKDSDRNDKENLSSNEMIFSESQITYAKKRDKYSPEYFESLHQNLKDINQLIEALDIDK